MKLAFYAPMKDPGHARPSGDRAMARALIAALKAAGDEPQLVSTFTSRDGTGNAARQADLMTAARKEVARLLPVGRAQGWRVWITYHNYYKAPDLLGPAVSKALGIPYLLVEASRAQKRLDGPWATFARAAEDACDAAQAIFCLTENDGFALRRDAPQGQRLIHLRPFLPRDDLPPASRCDGPMLCVGMMRAGDKLASYRIIAETLALLRTRDWRLEIAGDGPERAAVSALMAAFGNRVTFLGAKSAEELQDIYRGASLLIWPGVNEAFGMVYLEAQSHGVPVLAQDRPGVREVLAPGNHPSVEAGPEALASNADALLADMAARQQAGAVARNHIRDHHLIGGAVATIRPVLESLHP
jgi:glycosyltransferase involved in cell wall biosynthesis